MRTGISSPILAIAPAGERPPWEQAAGVPEIIQFAQAADRLGYEFLTASDHVAVPPGIERGEQFFDSLSTFSFLASVTERIRFLPYVLVIGFYHPLEIAKRYGTLDYLSNGRVTLGFGVGNLREEFDQLGVPFDDRGARANDALKALRATTGRREVSYDGEFFSFDNLVVKPHAVQTPIPMWVGGHSRRAMERAITLADGWAVGPMRFNGPDMTKLRQMLATVDVPEGFDVLVGAGKNLNPMTEPQEVQDTVGQWAEHGATVFLLTVEHNSLGEYIEQLEAYSELVGLA